MLDSEQPWAEAIDAHEAGDLTRARRIYQDVLRAQPHDADALHMLGLIAQQSGDLGQARTLLEEAIAVSSHSARTYYDLAIIRAAQGDVGGAISAYEAAIIFDPGFADAHSNLGSLYLQRGRRDDALRAFAAALLANPDLAVAHCNRATVLIDLERYDEAIAASQAALRRAPLLAQAHANLYQAYRRSGHIPEALAAALRGVDLQPDERSYLNLGVTALEFDALDVALVAGRRALDLDPTSAKAHSNLGFFYHLTGRYAESIAAGITAIALNPDFAGAHVNLALSLLVCGELARGWDEYSWIWRVPERRKHYPYFDPATLWNGESFAGRQLFITPDQGYGDAIQMVRYLPAIKARGGRVILEVPAPLFPLFTGFPGVDELRVAAAILPDDVDLQVPLLGIPRAFATDLTSIPAPIPYLHAQPDRVERWRLRLEGRARLRVGIAWAGNPGHSNDRRRSVRLEHFAALADIEDIAWFGLQKGCDEERRSCGLFQLDPLGAEIGDFADSAAILAQLDLLIAVDTSIVHLAGALGTPVWTLLPFAPDWRWLLERVDSPWYPSMRLFRQPRPGDWASVFAEVARELRALQVK